ncbi:MAG: enoyl-CoA hydratase/isomerase family protein [Acidimicrobiales bacterium]
MVWVTFDEIVDTTSSAVALSQLRHTVGGGALVVDRRGSPPLPEALATLPIVVVELCDGVDPDAYSNQSAGDVVLDSEADAAEVVAAIDQHPQAATALALLLRDSERRSIPDGIAAESATYSTLQAGPEFQSWLQQHRRKSRPPETQPPVRIERDEDVLRLVLQRSQVRNAFNAATREALLDGLLIAAAEPGVRVELRGDGPAFCAGGDLDEFGTADDPASAHLVRVARSAGYAIAAVADRVTAYLHGACIGAGIELPAFAGRVVAAPDATFALPEVGMGLIPGAGGTVSLPRRIGRQRTAWLAITGQRIDASTALAWRLIDTIDS